MVVVVLLWKLPFCLIRRCRRRLPLASTANNWANNISQVRIHRLKSVCICATHLYWASRVYKHGRKAAADCVVGYTWRCWRRVSVGFSEQVNYTYSGGGRRESQVRLIKFWAGRTLAALFLLQLTVRTLGLS